MLGEESVFFAACTESHTALVKPAELLFARGGDREFVEFLERLRREFGF